MNKTFYPIAEAERLAEANNQDDEEWTYVVEEPFAGRAAVAVYDEEGELIGYL